MKAARVVEPGRIEIEDVPTPDPSEGEVRVKLEGCGVCASNVPAFEGREWFEYPMGPGALGHEPWGVTDEGHRVAPLVNGAYAEYVVVDKSQIVWLPEVLAGIPFPAEPLACAMNIHQRTGHRPGDVVLVIGVGFLGALLTQLYTADGATVLATSRRPESLQWATAKATTPMDDHWRIVEWVKQHTDGRGADIVVECTGKQWPLDLATDAVREMGRLVVAGYHQDGPRTVNMQTWNWKGLDVINAHEREAQRYIDGMRRAVDAAVCGRLEHAKLLTHTYPLERLADALRDTASRPAGFLKGWIKF